VTKRSAGTPCSALVEPKKQTTVIVSTVPAHEGTKNENEMDSPGPVSKYWSRKEVSHRLEVDVPSWPFDTTVYIVIELPKSVLNFPFYSKENSLKGERGGRENEAGRARARERSRKNTSSGRFNPSVASA
jgi:hypothetical protein